MKKTCKTCGKADLKARICKVFGIPIKETDYCSFFPNDEETSLCENCGREILLSSIIDITEEKPVTLCPNCFNHKNTCITCYTKDKCDFETNPLAIPKVIQKRVQQGPMTTITQIRNPEREAATCKINCPCWDKEYEYCKREEYTCINYKPSWGKKND